MKVARMKLRRMHAHERDCVPRMVNRDHRIALGNPVKQDRSPEFGVASLFRGVQMVVQSSPKVAGKSYI